MASVAVKKEEDEPEEIELLLPEAQCWTVCSTGASREVLLTQMNRDTLDEFYEDLTNKYKSLRIESSDQAVTISGPLGAFRIGLRGYIRAVRPRYADPIMGITIDEGKRFFSELEKYLPASKKGPPCKETESCQERSVPDKTSQGQCFCINLKDIKLSGSIRSDGKRKSLVWQSVSASFQEANKKEGVKEEEEEERENEEGEEENEEAREEEKEKEGEEEKEDEEENKDADKEERNGEGVLVLPDTQCWSLRMQGRSKLVLREGNANAVKNFLRSKNENRNAKDKVDLPKPGKATIQTMKLNCKMRLEYSGRVFPEISCRLIAGEPEVILLVIQNLKDLYDHVGADRQPCDATDDCKEVENFRQKSRCIFLSNIRFRGISENELGKKIIQWSHALSDGHPTPEPRPAGASGAVHPASSSQSATIPTAAGTRRRPRWATGVLGEPGGGAPERVIRRRLRTKTRDPGAEAVPRSSTPPEDSDVTEELEKLIGDVTNLPPKSESEVELFAEANLPPAPSSGRSRFAKKFRGEAAELVQGRDQGAAAVPRSSSPPEGSVVESLENLLARKLSSLRADVQWKSVLEKRPPMSKASLSVEAETSSRVVYEAVMKIFYERLDLFQQLNDVNRDLILRDSWEVPPELREAYFTLQAAADFCGS